ncbi:hypothetical protein KSP40_PGU005439 [Platanthera guangdongensis]|uniref:IST1-like protein n=1 Tax=Platanthera guangdongensis TaxID=2320717 RepID=A0ABR2MVK2_9ASPA
MMFRILLGRKFSKKIKRLVKCINCRKDAIRKKKQAMVRYLRKDVADLLAGGHESNAFRRMDALIIETNYAACYDMIEQYCGCVLENLPTIRKERECPEGAMEAVATLIFAAARFSNLPELADLRTAFTKRYGTRFDSCVNREFVMKTRRKSISKEKKLQLMEDIAQEFSVSWNSEMFQKKISDKTSPTHVQLTEDNPVTEDEDADGSHELVNRNHEPSSKPLIQKHHASNQLQRDERPASCMPMDRPMIRELAKAGVDHGEFTHSKASHDAGKNFQPDERRDRPADVENFPPSNPPPPYVKSNVKKTPPHAVYLDPRDHEKSWCGRDDDRTKYGSPHSKLWDYENLVAEISALRTS